MFSSVLPIFSAQDSTRFLSAPAAPLSGSQDSGGGPLCGPVCYPISWITSRRSIMEHGSRSVFVEIGSLESMEISDTPQASDSLLVPPQVAPMSQAEAPSAPTQKQQKAVFRERVSGVSQRTLNRVFDDISDELWRPKDRRHLPLKEITQVEKASKISGPLWKNAHLELKAPVAGQIHLKMGLGALNLDSASNKVLRRSYSDCLKEVFYHSDHHTAVGAGWLATKGEWALSLSTDKATPKPYPRCPSDVATSIISGGLTFSTNKGAVLKAEDLVDTWDKSKCPNHWRISPTFSRASYTHPAGIIAAHRAQADRTPKMRTALPRSKCPCGAPSSIWKYADGSLQSGRFCSDSCLEGSFLTRDPYSTLITESFLHDPLRSGSSKKKLG